MSESEHELKNGNLVRYRLEIVEGQLSELAKVVQSTHDVVLVMKDKLSAQGVLECQVHRERMNTFEGKIKALETSHSTIATEVEGLKKFMWKVSGALIVASFIIQTFIVPLLVP